MKLLPIGLTAAGSLIGNKLSKIGTGPTAAERQVLNQDATAQNRTLAAGTSSIPAGQSLIGMGSAGYQPVLNYWSRILSGNRGDMTQAMAPEINRIAEGYQAATNTSAALSPRGGPSVEFNAELPFQQQRDVTSVLQQARPQAATGLLSGANQATNAGSQILNNATNAIYSSTAAGRDILTNQENIRKQQAETGKAMGKGLFDLISRYGPDIISLINRGKTPSGGTNNGTNGGDVTVAPGIGA